MNVGYVGNGYCHKRLIINRCSLAKYIKISKGFDVGYVTKFLVSKLVPSYANTTSFINRMNFEFSPIFISQNIHLLHVYIITCKVNIPWVASIENMFPAYKWDMQGIERDKYVQSQIPYLVADTCKKLLPLSEYSFEQIKKLLAIYCDKDTQQIIENKMQILHPAQELLITRQEIEEKIVANRKLRFIFVGRDFWRKGGAICLKALEKYRKDVEFTLISSLGDEDLAYRSSRQELLKYISNNRDWINYYPSTSNEDTLKLMISSDVGLLPTYADTYGFSVLEMQSAGLPCITTDVCALPHMNNSDIGWVLEVSNGTSIEISQRNTAEEGLILQLQDKIEYILNHRDEIIKKGICSLDFIQRNRNLENYSAALSEIYHDAIA